MKKIIKLFLMIAVFFMGTGAFAVGGGSIEKFLSPNVDVYEVRASHVLVKTRKEALQIKKDIESGKITFEEAAEKCFSGVGKRTETRNFKRKFY